MYLVRRSNCPCNLKLTRWDLQRRTANQHCARYSAAVHPWKKRYEILTHLRSRDTYNQSGHVMTIEPESRFIYILAGRRHDTFFGDMFIFHCDTHQVKEVNLGQGGSVDFCVIGARAAVDQRQGEMYL